MKKARPLSIFLALAVLILYLAACFEDNGSRQTWNPSDFVYVSSSVKHGPLILVNRDHSFDPATVGALVGLSSNDAHYFRRDNNQRLNSDALTALCKMLSDFAAVNKTDWKPIIFSTFRDEAQQAGLFNGGNPKFVAPPRHSEHHTGLAVDMSAQQGVGGTQREFNDPVISGTFDWFYKNAHKYGFILRYPADKTKITGFEFEPWHFRYVGIPHAGYMYSNNLALEEYIALLATKSAQNPLIIQGAPVHYVYTVSSSSDIPVHRDFDYEVSSSNTGSFIVTAWKAE